MLTVTETLRQATQNAQDQAGQEASLVQVCFYFCAQVRPGSGSGRGVQADGKRTA